MKARGERFTSLPADLHAEQRLTLEQACMLTGRGRSRFYLEIKAGTMPEPAERMGRFVRWRAGDLLAALGRRQGVTQ